MTQIKLRPVIDSDLPLFYLHQVDKVAVRIADFPSRTEDAFYTHWHKIMANAENILRTVLWEGQVAGNIVSFIMAGKREVGYWFGREYWGKGIATAALELFLKVVTERPLYGVTAKSNPGSARVLEKCGFELFQSSEKETIFRLK